MQNMIDENLDRIDKAGGAVGNLVGKIARFLGKNAIAAGAILILGIGVFIYSIISGAMKKDKS
jgi:hypothetical protein